MYTPKHTEYQAAVERVEKTAKALYYLPLARLEKVRMVIQLELYHNAIKGVKKHSVPESVIVR